MSLRQLNRDLFDSAFKLLRESKKTLASALGAMSIFHDVQPILKPEDLFSYLRFADTNNPTRLALGSLFAFLDYYDEGEWAIGTPRSTPERRDSIYSGMNLTAEQRTFCDELFPRYPAIDPPIVITDHAHWKRWYTPERRKEHAFFWPAYIRYLSEVKGWSGKNVAVFDTTTTDVVERITDPCAPVPYQSKGLVVGYVQSGKTAHYTGVIAKAADAGYRLIIVLAGSINILREQTQRRLDKELLGWELVQEDYEGDLEESDFLRHGGLPSVLRAFDWERLTLAKEDFRRLTVGIPALEFRKFDPALPLNHPDNIHRERARLMVVKKNSSVLGKLIDALRRASKRNDLTDVPTLIIDDESDQASVNTRKPKPDEVRERTAINKHIVTLMGMLSRAQYIGYTATPFANVFIDPDDASDLFPSDFLISLPKPEGYMGVSDFYDNSEPIPGDYMFNRNAFVRPVVGGDEIPGNLPEAIDAYILSGAVKLYREKHGSRPYRHHTMLVHHSAFTTIHRDLAEQVEQFYLAANYLGGGPGISRLKALWEKDFEKVSRVRADATSEVPSSFDELRPFIGECCRRISDGGRPVLVVNGDDKEDTPNFEKSSVWKIIVGGTKLSRGYTVEGLTISYYRRTAQTADTLMQMGRWFGYRAGYGDLVRLYIGTEEPLDKRGRNSINLYLAFHAVCRDEEEFRADLERYSNLDGNQRITPKQIPPLVPSHMLKPTASNKMYNAVLDYENFGGRWIERTVAPSAMDDLKFNERATRRLLEGASIRRVALGFSNGGRLVEYEALVCNLPPQRVREYLREYRWAPGKNETLARVNEFLSGTKGDPEIENWLFLAPQRKVANRPWTAAEHDFDERRRERVQTGGRYAVYSEPDHVATAEYLAGTNEELESPSRDLLSLMRQRQAVLLFYPVRSEDEQNQNQTVNMGFGIQFPNNHIPRRIRYTVKRQDQANAVTVEVS